MLYRPTGRRNVRRSLLRSASQRNRRSTSKTKAACPRRDPIAGKTFVEKPAPPQRRKERSRTTRSKCRPPTPPSPESSVAVVALRRAERVEARPFLQLPFSL